MSSKPRILPQIIAAFAANIGGLAIGTVLGYSSPVGVILTNSTSSNIHLNYEQNGWFSSISNLGALVGGLVAGFFINYLGRKGTMIYSLIPALIGWILIAAAQNFAMLILGRIVCGFYSGIISLAVPTYIGEFSSPHIRGTLSCGFTIMIMLGILFSYCMGAVFENSYQWIAVSCAVWPCLSSILVFFFNKESPHYLLSKGKEEEAEISLRFFRGKDYEGLDKELEAIRLSLEESKKNKATFKDLKTPYILKPLLMSLGLMFFQQFSGINAVLFNLSLIFADAGSDLSSNLSSIIIGVTQVATCIVAAGLTDKAGRKIMLSLSAAIMTISLVVLGLFFYMKEYQPATAETISWLPMVSLITFVVSYSFGSGPIPWIMMGELFSAEIKELSASISTMLNWTFSFIITLIFAPLQNLIFDHGVYWMFAGFCALNFIFVVSFVFETKGKTLQEINAHFGGPQTTVTRDRQNL